MCKDPAMTVTRLVTGNPPPHRVVVLALPSVVAFELGLPHRFFAANSIDPAWTGAGAYTPSRAPAYEVLTVTVDDGPVTTSAGYQVTPTHPNTVLPTADTIVIRPATTFDKTSIRCRSRSLIAINPICNLPDVIQTRGV